MKDSNWSTVTALATFVIGVILLWSFGRDWLKFDSHLVVLTGLAGVALPVFIFAIWKLSHRTPDEK